MKDSRRKSRWKTRRSSSRPGGEQVGQIGLEVAAGPGPGAVVVQAPDAAVGEQAPADPALRLDLGGGQVAEDLAVGRPGVESGLPVALVQGQAEALALLHDGGVPGAGGGVRLGRGAFLGAGVGEEQVVGDVLVARRALLRQVVGPPEQLQHRPDEILLGDRLVGVGGPGEGFVMAEDGLAEGGEGLGVSGRGLPLGGGPDAVGEEVVGEELAAHGESLIRSAGAAHVDDTDRDLACLDGGEGGLQPLLQFLGGRRRRAGGRGWSASPAEPEYKVDAVAVGGRGRSCIWRSTDLASRSIGRGACSS